MKHIDEEKLETDLALSVSVSCRIYWNYRKMI